MREVLLLVLVARVAVAAPDIDGRVSLRMPAGDGLNVVVATTNVSPIESVGDIMAADPDLAGVKIERLSRVRSAVAFIAVPALPHRVHGRVLVVAVDALARDGTLVSLRFYVESIDRAVKATALAREAASTLEIRIDPTPLPPLVEWPHLPLPNGWYMRSDNWYTRITSPHGECKVLDGELDVRAAAPASATKVPSDLRGDTVYWSTWSDGEGYHAELIAGAKHWGTLHATCHASTRAESFEQRQLVVRELQ